MYSVTGPLVARLLRGGTWPCPGRTRAAAGRRRRTGRTRGPDGRCRACRSRAGSSRPCSSRSIAYLSARRRSRLSKGGVSAAHREGVVAGARHVVDLDPRRALEQRDGLGIEPVDEVRAAGLQRAGARGQIVDREGLDGVDVAPALLPVVRVAGREGAHAGLELLDDEGAGAERGGRVGVLRHDHEVIVGDDVGHVRVAGLEHDGDLVRVARLEVGRSVCR